MDRMDETDGMNELPELPKVKIENPKALKNRGTQPPQQTKRSLGTPTEEAEEAGIVVAADCADEDRMNEIARIAKIAKIENENHCGGGGQMGADECSA